MTGFTVQFSDSPTGTGQLTDLAHIQFSAAVQGETRPVLSSLPELFAGVDNPNIKMACLSNVGCDGGLRKAGSPPGSAKCPLPPLHECNIGDERYDWASRDVHHNDGALKRWHIWVTFVTPSSMLYSSLNDSDNKGQQRCLIA